MASSTPQRPEISHDTTVWTQYYHCVIRNIPYDMPPPALADHLMVQEGSPVAKSLAELGRFIVLHTMYTYKETLKDKFGYLGLFLKCTPGASPDEESKIKAHQLVKEWIDKELTPQLLIGGMGVTLAQPAACYHARPFLKAFRDKCSITSKDISLDPMKMETFLFTHVAFNADDNDANKAFNPTWAREGESFEANANKSSAGEVEGPSAAQSSGEEPNWTPVGTFSVSSLTPQELMWMKKNCVKFPPISITNGDPSTAHVEGDALVKYFTEHLSPLITVTK